MANTVGRKPIKRGASPHGGSQTLRLADEVRYIQRRQPITMGASLPSASLSCFTDTGDAWLLDPSDQLAARLARDGDPEPLRIEENDTAFAIDWKGRYRIMIRIRYIDRTGNLTTVHGYPTHKLRTLRTILSQSPVFAESRHHRIDPS